MDNQTYTDEYSIDLRDIFRILKKRIWLILLIPTIAVLIAGVMAFYTMTPIYQASTTLLVWKTPTTQNQVQSGDITTNRQLVTTYREIARSTTVMAEVVKNLGLGASPGELRSMVEVAPVGTTEIIQISVTNAVPATAQLLADAVAKSFMDNVIRIMQVDNVVVVDTANLPASPIKPQKKMIVAVAGFLGLMASAFLVFILEYLDNTIKTPADVERYLGLPILGAIPRFKASDLSLTPKGD